MRDGVAELAVEKREGVVYGLCMGAMVRVRLEHFKMRHVVAFVHKQLAVQRRGREILPHFAVAAQVAPMVRVGRREHIHARAGIERRDCTMVAFD